MSDAGPVGAAAPSPRSFMDRYGIGLIVALLAIVVGLVAVLVVVLTKDDDDTPGLTVKRTFSCERLSTDKCAEGVNNEMRKACTEGVDAVDMSVRMLVVRGYASSRVETVEHTGVCDDLLGR